MTKTLLSLFAAASTFTASVALAETTIDNFQARGSAAHAVIHAVAEDGCTTSWILISAEDNVSSQDSGAPAPSTYSEASVQIFNACDFSMSFGFGYVPVADIDPLRSAHFSVPIDFDGGVSGTLDVTLTGTGDVTRDAATDTLNEDGVHIVSHLVTSRRQAVVTGSVDMGGLELMASVQARGELSSFQNGGNTVTQPAAGR